MDFQQSIAYNIRKNARKENFAKIAKVITVHPGGLYTVELSGGQTINKLNTNSSGFKYTVDQWVTLEHFGGDWIIAGESAQKGGG